MQSLGVDVLMIFVSLLMGVLFSSAVVAVNNANGIGDIVLSPPQWLIFLSCLLPSLISLFLDTLSALSNPSLLPFARSQAWTKAIYTKRFHLLLLALYFTTILVALCWSAPSMPLFSKIFVSAVFGIALYALGQSIPSKRTSFLVSGILFLVVLVATQAFIVLQMKAESAREKQKVLDEFGAPAERSTLDDNSDERDDSGFSFE